MATSTQKAAARKKAGAAKADAPGSQPAASSTSKSASKASAKAPPTASAGAKAPRGKQPQAKTKPGKAKGKKSPQHDAVTPTATSPKPSWGERFWHALGGKAKANEEVAHQHKLEREAQRQRDLEAEEEARKEALEQAHQLKLQHDAEERRKTQASKREMLRIAKEEEARLKAEAHEAKLARAREARAEAARVKREAADRARQEEEARVAAAQAAKEAKLAAAKEARAEAARAKREAAARAREEETARLAAAEAAKESRLIAAREARAEAARIAAAKEAERKEQRRLRDAQRREQARAEKVAREQAAAEAKAEAARIAAEKKEEAKRVAAERKAEAERLAEEQERRDEEARREALAHEVAKATRRAKEGHEAKAEPKAESKHESKAEETARPAKGEATAKAHGDGKGSSAALDQADRLAQELASRRSKPIVIDADDDAPAPTLPGVGRNRAPRDGEPAPQELVTTPAPPAKIVDAAPRGLTLPESFILLALEDKWDERRERAQPGSLGGALAGAMVLELALRGRVLVQRDRLTISGSPLDDAALEAVAQRLSPIQEEPSLQAMAHVAKANPELLPAFKDRLKGRGLIDHAHWRHMGMLHRSQVILLDEDAQERLRGKLRRAIAGGGTPDAPTILSLGLLDAAGLLETVVPAGAIDYNRKRLNGLLAGRDVMGYVVDKELKGLQEVAVRTILANVRTLTVRG